MQSKNSDQRVAAGERAQQRKQWDMGQSDSHAEACRSLQKLEGTRNGFSESVLLTA